MDRIAAISTIDEVIPIISKDKIVTAQTQDDVVGLKSSDRVVGISPRDVPCLLLQGRKVPDRPVSKRRLLDLEGRSADGEEVLHRELIGCSRDLEDQIGIVPSDRHFTRRHTGDELHRIHVSGRQVIIDHHVLHESLAEPIGVVAGAADQGIVPPIRPATVQDIIPGTTP